MPSPSVALLRTQSDERLAALAAAGHERAFEAIVERYRRPLLRHCRRYLPEARAEDALQQALVAAWTALRRGDDVQALRPWLYRIVHNTALNALRAAGYDYEELREILLPTDPREGPAELVEHRAVVQRTLAGLAALPERQRQALLQIAVEGRSQDEVAEDLGLSTGGVRQLVHRARTSLRTAATAAVPLPLAGWLATAGGGRADVALRMGELVAGAGAGATLAKAGTVAVLAGGIVSGPAVVDELRGREHRLERAAAVRHDAGREARRAETAAAAATATPAPTATPAAASAVPQVDPRTEDGRTRRAQSREDDGRRGAQRPRDEGEDPGAGARGGGQPPDDDTDDEGDRGRDDERAADRDDDDERDAGRDRGRPRSEGGGARRGGDDDDMPQAEPEDRDEPDGSQSAPSGSGSGQEEHAPVGGGQGEGGSGASGPGFGDEGPEPDGEFED